MPLHLVWALVCNLPHDRSCLRGAYLSPEARQWSRTDYLLADLIDATRSLLVAWGAQASDITPYPRPEKQVEAEQLSPLEVAIKMKRMLGGL